MPFEQSANSIYRVNNLETWDTTTRQVGANALLGTIWQVLRPSDQIAIPNSVQYGRMPTIDFPADRIGLAARMAINNANFTEGRLDRRYRLRPELQAFTSDSAPHHDGVEGEYDGLLTSLVLQDAIDVWLRRIPTFDTRELAGMRQTYFNPDRTINLDMIAEAFTRVRLRRGDMLAFAGCGNKDLGTYPVMHYFQTIEAPRVSVSILHRDFVL